MNHRTLIMCFLLFFLLAIPCIGQQTATKHLVAILDFNQNAVVSDIAAEFGSAQNVGSYFSDMLATQLTTDGAMRVVDRQGLNKSLQMSPLAPNEPNPNMGGLLYSGPSNDPKPQINKVGMIYGVNQVINYFEADTLITGEIISAGKDDARKRTIVKNVSDRIHGHCHASKAVLGVSARMLDLNTGEILASSNVKATSPHSGCNILVAHEYTNSIHDIHDTNFPSTILGEAFKQAVLQIARDFEKGSSNAPIYNPMQIMASVADISGSNITINVGAVGGVHSGDTLLVTHISRAIMDPQTQKLLHNVEDSVGQIVITSVKPFYAIGTFSGTGKVSLKDTVKTMPK